MELKTYRTHIECRPFNAIGRFDWRIWDCMAHDELEAVKMAFDYAHENKMETCGIYARELINGVEQWRVRKP